MTTKMECPSEEDLLRTGQAASRLGLSERYLEILRVRGDGPPFVNFGRCVRYRPFDLDRWVETRLRRSTSERFDAGSGAFPANRQNRQRRKIGQASSFRGIRLTKTPAG
jgi:hypothetical protein